MRVRLQHPLRQGQLIQPNEEFSDMMEYRQCEPIETLPEEDAEGGLVHLPQVAFHFSWNELGRLRPCIDC